ncbi:ras-related protein Rab-44 isoform X5 [Alexandromys fortis]|uniref:ras-related protein Rab-44 isoform X5 n=1 Tax=Alexandromys fortis TaxID=100897 RepID=UPI0021537A06|nr:ras-related protein Rab-44 isoform X5 [Microtus fortis]
MVRGTMENGKGGFRKGRKLASSRRRQIREPADGQDAPATPEPESWPSHSEEELQSFFRDCGARERGFVTREDLAEAKFSFLGNEEPQMIFDWVDTEHKGRLSLEEFSSGLKNVFGSSPRTHRLHRKRPVPSQRASGAFSLPALEEADAKEKEAFLALVGQMGTGHSLSEQAEIWRLWGELQQEEPQLAGNLEGFLAKMSSRLQEARADREALEWTLRKQDSDHLHKVRQLYEETEEQIRREKQQLQAQSDSRGMALSTHMQEVLEAKEQEVQRLAESQRELEAQLLHLSSSQQEASWENLQLREAERDLAGQLEEVRGQLQVTRGRLNTARGRVSWQIEEEPSVPRENEKAPDPQAVPTEEAPLPELFGDNEDWNQLLSSFGDHSHRALQLCWSPPPTPSGTSGPQTPRIVRQISISQMPALQFTQESTSDPDPSPRSPAGVPAGAKDRQGVADPEGQDGQDGSSEQPVDTPGLEAGSKSPFPWSLPAAQAEESGSVGTEAFRVLLAPEAEPPPQGLSLPPQFPAGSRKQFQAPDLSDKSLWPELDPAKLPMEREVLRENLKDLGLESQGATALPEGAAEPSLSLEPVSQVESKPDTSQPTEPGLPSRLGDPGTDSGEAKLTFPGDLTAGKPQADPDYLYHVIFLGDSNVGKTSFLHLLHHDAFATGLTATVGVDFRVKRLTVDNKNFALQLWDTAGQERYHSLTRQLLHKADGVVLMYDVTSRESFSHVRYWLDCLQDAGADGVAMVLLGNKMDCEEERQVPAEAGRRLAQELGISFGECSAILGHNILEPLMNLARTLKMQEDRLKASMVEVTHQQPPKRASCCR